MNPVLIWSYTCPTSATRVRSSRLLALLSGGASPRHRSFVHCPFHLLTVGKRLHKRLAPRRDLLFSAPGRREILASRCVCHRLRRVRNPGLESLSVEFRQVGCLE